MSDSFSNGLSTIADVVTRFDSVRDSDWRYPLMHGELQNILVDLSNYNSYYLGYLIDLLGNATSLSDNQRETISSLIGTAECNDRDIQDLLNYYKDDSSYQKNLWIIRIIIHMINTLLFYI